MIRGGYRSRTMESIEEEARGLVENGAKELILIAQDTTRYGIDLYGEYSLAKLMRRLCKIDGLKWLRVLYCYPDALTDELLETMAEEEKIVKYIDLPLQHASARVLKRMNRTAGGFDSRPDRRRGEEPPRGDHHGITDEHYGPPWRKAGWGGHHRVDGGL